MRSRPSAASRNVAPVRCDEWLGKVLSVVDDGHFAGWGCAGLASSADQQACLRGAAAINSALVTFS